MTVAAVLAALADVDGAVEVVGDDASAAELRAALADRLCQPGTAPAAIVETSGDGQAVTAAMSRVADLGTLVLAGPPPRAPVALDLYADLHVRGLVIVGVPPVAEWTA